MSFFDGKTTISFETASDITDGRHPDFDLVDDSVYDPELGAGWVVREKATGELYFIESNNIASWDEGSGLDWDYESVQIHKVQTKEVMITSYVPTESFEISFGEDDEDDED